MNTFFRTIGFSLALMLATFASPARAQDYAQDNIDDQTGATADQSVDPGSQAPTGSVSFQQFYNQLSDYGSWINTDKYGYVFQPTESDPNWSPYTYGHWVNSDAGLTWVGDDPFSWATDHYGRWVNLDGQGWVWVPGYTWAPAWVSWRQGDDEVGWAPLPPDSDYGIDYYGDNYPWDYGYHIGDDSDLAYGIGPWWYNFCPIIFIGDRDCYHHFHHRGDNFGLIGRTHNVTNLNFTRGEGRGRFGSVHANGPSVVALNARARTPIQNVRLARASTLDNAGLHGGTLSVFAPRVDPATRSTARPANVSETTANTRVNHGTDINHGLAVNSHLAAPVANAGQIHAADAVRTVPGFANARVATDNTHFTHSFGGSLNTMRTEPSSVTTFNTGTMRTPAMRSVTPGYSSEPRAFVNGNSSRVFAPQRTTRIYNDYPAASTYRSFGGASTYSDRAYAPAYGYHSSAPAYHSYTPSYHSYAAPSYGSFSEPHFNGGGYSHASGGGFSGGGHYGGGGGFSGGGGGHFGGGGGGHR